MFLKIDYFGIIQTFYNLTPKTWVVLFDRSLIILFL